MIYPSDPHINETYYPFGQAELTLEGKRNAYNFGVEIRARYQSFLNETYFPPEIKAFTSNISRTQMTLQSVLTAMYPPIYPNVVLPYLMWQPISYETIPTNDDTVYNKLGLTQLPQYLNFIFKLIMVNCSKKLETPVKRDQELQNLYDYVSAHAGKKMIDSNDIMNVYNTILVEKQNGFPVPDWAEEIFNNGKLQDAALSLWVDIIEQQLPIISGNLIRKITEDSVKKTKNEIANQIFLYSGHDTTVAGMLGVFDAYTKFELEYLSHVYIELHKIDDVYGFKVNTKTLIVIMHYTDVIVVGIFPKRTWQ